MSSEKSLTPQIRFKGFTEAWEQRKLGELLQYEQPQKYIVISSEYNDSFDIPVLTAGQSFILGWTNEKTGIKKASPDNPVIIFDDFVTSSHYVDFPFKIKSSAMKLLSSTNSTNDINFSFNLLKQIDYTPISHMRHWISMFAQFNVYTPTANEQVKIGRIFNKLDSLITLHQRKLDTLKKIKSALLEKMFPKDSSNIPEIRFTGFTEAWEQRKFLTIYRKNDERNDAGLSADKTLSVATMTFNCDGNGASAESLPNYKRLRIGDVAFEGHTNKEFSFGRFVLNDAGDGIMSPRFTCLRPITKQDYSFWKHYIHSEKVMKEKLVNSTKSGTMMNELVVEDFLNESILIPSLEEQKKIGFIFKSLTNLITLHQRKLDALKKIKSALLEKMFV